MACLFPVEVRQVWNVLRLPSFSLFYSLFLISLSCNGNKIQLCFTFSFLLAAIQVICWVTRKVEIFEARLEIVDGNYVAMVTSCYHSNIEVLATHE